MQYRLALGDPTGSCRLEAGSGSSGGGGILVVESWLVGYGHWYIETRTRRTPREEFD